MSRTKNWCWTLNNYTPEEQQQIERLCAEEAATYVCFGQEVGAQGTRHLQGYCEVATRKRIAGIKALSGLSRAHLEPRRGSQEQAIEYCRKDGQFSEFGTKSVVSQGKRSDLDAFKESIDAGRSEAEVADDYFGVWSRHPELYHRYKRLKSAKQARDIRVVFLWGEPGTGKTRGVFETYPDAWINSDPSLQWFDGYNGESIVLLDDYRGQASDAFILKLLDRYPMQVPVKGGFRDWLPTTIFVTSNCDPREMHVPVAQAFRRRIHAIHHLQGNLYAAGCEPQLEVFLRVLRPLVQGGADDPRDAIQVEGL